MYARNLEGRTIEFGHRGWLLDDSFLFYDRDTDSIWCQATGKAVLGPRRGQKLATLPVVHTTWHQWRRLHPETRVLAKPAAAVEEYLSDRYSPYYDRKRLTFGLAVCLPQGQRLYPFESLAHMPVVNDEVAGQSLVVAIHWPTKTAMAWRRTAADILRTFEIAETTPTDVILRDRSSGRRWSGLTGRCLDLGDNHAPLEAVVATQFVVEKFMNHFPEGTIFATQPDSR